MVQSNKELFAHVPNKQRIRETTNKYAGVSIAEAFAQEYGYDVTGLSEPPVPSSTQVGDVIEVTIKSITKEHGVRLDNRAQKELFLTRNPLEKYFQLLDWYPKEPLRARIVERTPHGTYVDILGQMVADYLEPRAASPWIQNKVGLGEPAGLIVKDLQLLRGGYTGKAVIPSVSDFIGEDYTIDAFIPGSHITLNTTDSFELYDGTSVTAQVLSWNPNASYGAPLICSRKNALALAGNRWLMSIYSDWCDGGETWSDITGVTYEGKVTGVLNSSNYCGVFVEILELGVNGMIKTKPDELVNYPAGKTIPVKVKDLEIDTFYNPAVDQRQRKEPFVIVGDALKEVNVRLILEDA